VKHLLGQAIENLTKSEKDEQAFIELMNGDIFKMNMDISVNILVSY